MTFYDNWLGMWDQATDRQWLRLQHHRRRALRLEDGSTLVVPFGAVHQHFNTGQATARYFSAMSVHLEHMCGLQRHTQLAERGTTGHIPNVPRSPNGFDSQGRRIHLFQEEAEVRIGGRVHTREMPLSADAVELLPDIARRAHGFVGADLMKLNREGALSALRRSSASFLDRPSVAS
jgi:SpoVK/Ycf46/Vps4 family AAA+-type ATPase